MTNFIWSGTGTNSSWGNAANWTNQATGAAGLPTDLDNAYITAPGTTVTIDAGLVAAAYTLTTNGAALAFTGGTLTTEHHANFNGQVLIGSGTYYAGGTGATFNQYLTQTGGTLDAVTGTLVVNDGSSLSGTVAGAGALDFNGGDNYIAKGFTCAVSAIEVTNGGRLGLQTSLNFAHNLTVANATLDLFGNTLTDTGAFALSGLAGGGTIADAGTLTLGSNIATETLDNGLILAVTGTVIQANTVFLGAADSGAKVSIGKAGQYDINGNWNIYDPSSIGSIANAGTFAKTGGGKLTQVVTQLSSTGTIAANIGELQLDGLVNTISGTVSGAGTFGIGVYNTYSQTTFQPKLALNVANFHQAGGNLVINAAQSYAGNWNMSGGVLNLNAAAAILTLNGASNFDNGTLSGYRGTLVLNGPAELNTVTIGGPDKIDVNGTLTQTGLVYLGQSSNPEVTIAKAGKWLIDADFEHQRLVRPDRQSRRAVGPQRQRHLHHPVRGDQRRQRHPDRRQQAAARLALQHARRPGDRRRPARRRRRHHHAGRRPGAPGDRAERLLRRGTRRQPGGRPHRLPIGRHDRHQRPRLCAVRHHVARRRLAGGPRNPLGIRPDHGRRLYRDRRGRPADRRRGRPDRQPHAGRRQRRRHADRGRRRHLQRARQFLDRRRRQRRHRRPPDRIRAPAMARSMPPSTWPRAAP